jgi:hypothetical protein
VRPVKTGETHQWETTVAMEQSTGGSELCSASNGDGGCSTHRPWRWRAPVAERGREAVRYGHERVARVVMSLASPGWWGGGGTAVTTELPWRPWLQRPWGGGKAAR